MNHLPRMSCILATDTYDTIRPVIERFRRQSVKHQLEIVLVTTSAKAVSPALAHREEFAGMQIIEVPTIVPLAVPRAAGIRAASAPLVFIGETHTFPHQDFAEVLINTLDGPWAAVIPGFHNANPKTAISCASFIADYGPWVDGVPAGEIERHPLYNCVFRRSVLLEFGDRLVSALSYSDELPLTLKARGHRVYFEPAARIEHLNIARPWAWVHERFVCGMLTAAQRATRWSTARRLFYVAASILIPFVLLKRVVPGAIVTARGRDLPRATLALVVLGMFVRSAGEFVGYAIGPGANTEIEAVEYEVHKLAYSV